jgi:threonine/homoserine/homoserine lactone efflux protein
VSALLAASATAFTVLKWLGAAYLVYVGVRMLLSARLPQFDHAWTDGRPAGGMQPENHLAARLLDQCAEPQGGVVLPGFRAAVHCARREQQGAGVLLLGLLFNFNGLWVNIGLGAGGGVAGLARGAVQKGMHWLDRVAGVMFIGFGLKLATSRQSRN